MPGHHALQVIRDWVLRFNDRGPDGLVNGRAPGKPSRLSAAHRTALAGVVGPAHPFAAQAGTSLDEPMKRLARALGRQGARRHIARGSSILEIALVLTLVAAAATVLAWSRSWR